MKNLLVRTAFCLVVALPSAAQQHVNQKQGFNANDVYAVHDIDTVNAFNGNLTVRIPIGPQFPLAEGFSYGFALHGNANFWESEVENDPMVTKPLPDSGRTGGVTAHVEGCNSEDGYVVAHPHRRANAGLGWILTLGRLYPWQSSLVRGWVYESPDGADHEFPNRPGADGVMYTADNSYLRLKADEAAGMATVEFPDGTYHTFRRGNRVEDPWMPVEFAHRRSTQKLTIDYATANKWVLTDSHGRSHTVEFELRDWEGGQRPMVKRVTLSAFTPAGTAQRHAVYELAYATHVDLPRPPWHEPCAVAWPNKVTIQKLESVTFPSETGEGLSRFAFEYDTAPLQSPGVLSKATLPTGGSIVWLWRTYQKPLLSAIGSEYLAESWGVWKRQLWRPQASTFDAEWKYEGTVDANPTSDAARELHTLVSDPLNNKTLHFFAVSPTDATVNGTTWEADEYGLPFTRKHAVGSLASPPVKYLSQLSYPPDVTPDFRSPLTGALRATYLQYESDAVGAGPGKNWRVKSRREVTYTPSGSEWIDTESDDFDGLGHYRKTTVKGSFETSSKTTITNYKPEGSSTVPSGPNWVLGLYDSIKVFESGGDESTTQFHFEEDGRLRRTRSLRGTTAGVTDLVTVFDDSDNDGNLDRERLYGGNADGKALPENYSIDGQTDPQVVSYTIDHTSDNGVRASSQHAGASFKSLDLSISRVGLPETSKDVSGLFTTTYDYNLRGQLRSIKPAGEAWTEYQYSTNPAAFPPASVVVKQWPSTLATPSATSVPLTETRYYYDYFGRMIQKRAWLSSASSSSWSVISYKYDDLGRQDATSAIVGASSGSYSELAGVPDTTTSYDPLGRVRKITQPDGNYVENTYTGVSTVERSVSIRTSPDGETRVATKETYDALGRLTAVVEDSAGAAEQTTYDYDEGDRLSRVVAGGQERKFLYDGAGLLTEEQHPESGTTTYEYDARGHVIKKVTPAATLTMTYDAAERVVTVTQQNVGDLQNFEYDGAGAANGKIEIAKRHNRRAGFDDVVVSETFTYGGRGGRVSQKTTTVGVTSFTERYEYDELAALETLEYPGCDGCGFTPPSREVTNAYRAGFLTAVTGYTSLIRYHPNGLLASLRHRNADGSNGPLFTQTIDASTRMARPASTSVTNYCDGFEITEALPPQKTVSSGAPADLTVTAPGATTYEWYILGSTEKLADQAGATLTYPVTTTTSFWARVGNGTCTVDSNVSTVYVQSCGAPDARITAPATVGPAAEASAMVAGEGSQFWTIENGTIVTGENAQTVTFRAACSGTVRLHARVVASCGTEARSTREVPIVAPAVTVSASPSTITQGESTTLTVNVTGGPWTVTWSDGYVQSGVRGSATRPAVTPSATTTYTVTQLNGCANSYGSTTVTVMPPAPIGLMAAKSGSGIVLGWSMPSGASADSFQIDRCSSACATPSASWTPLGASGVASYVDTAIAPEKAYVYRVRALKAGTSSLPSAPDFATTFAFTDDPVVTGVTMLKLVHIAELRSAVSALRVAAGLSAATFTDALQPGLAVRSTHFTELRSALNAARSQFGFGPVVLDPAPVAGSLIRAAHVNQLREGVQ